MAEQTEAQKKFVEDLKERLVGAGKKNVAIEADSLEENQKKAMENIAEAFSEPVKEFIDSETSQVANISIVSYDRSVDINSGVDPVTRKKITNLSVANTVNDAISNHNVDENAHEDIRADIAAETAAREAAVLRIAPPESAGTGEVIFYRGGLI